MSQKQQPRRPSRPICGQGPGNKRPSWNKHHAVSPPPKVASTSLVNDGLGISRHSRGSFTATTPGRYSRGSIHAGDWEIIDGAVSWTKTEAQEVSSDESLQGVEVERMSASEFVFATSGPAMKKTGDDAYDTPIKLSHPAYDVNIERPSHALKNRTPTELIRAVHSNTDDVSADRAKSNWAKAGKTVTMSLAVKRGSESMLQERLAVDESQIVYESESMEDSDENGSGSDPDSVSLAPQPRRLSQEEKDAAVGDAIEAASMWLQQSSQTETEANQLISQPRQEKKSIRNTNKDIVTITPEAVEQAGLSCARIPDSTSTTHAARASKASSFLAAAEFAKQARQVRLTKAASKLCAPRIGTASNHAVFFVY